MDCCQLTDYWLRKPRLKDLPKPQRVSKCKRDLELGFPCLTPELGARVALKRMLLCSAHVLQTRVDFKHERVAYDLKTPKHREHLIQNCVVHGEWCISLTPLCFGV